jgi:hypothetical protein
VTVAPQWAYKARRTVSTGWLAPALTRAYKACQPPGMQQHMQPAMPRVPGAAAAKVAAGGRAGVSSMPACTVSMAWLAVALGCTFKH